MAPSIHSKHDHPPTAAELGWKRHSPFAIAKMISDALKNKPTDPSNNPLKEWMYKGLARIDADDDDSVREALHWLREGKILMSKEFFFGKLDDVSVNWERGMLHNMKAYGCTIGYGQDARIFLEPHLEGRLARGSYNTPISLASTLLHELCHAMPLRYSCVNYCADPYCRRRRAVDTGPTHHGESWQDIKRIVEIAWEKVVGFWMDLE